MGSEQEPRNADRSGGAKVSGPTHDELAAAIEKWTKKVDDASLTLDRLYRLATSLNLAEALARNGARLELGAGEYAGLLQGPIAPEIFAAITEAVRVHVAKELYWLREPDVSRGADGDDHEK